MNMDVDTTIDRCKIERHEQWREWIDKIPKLSFPERWLVQVIPPFAGAMARFQVFHGEGRVSVYLDCYERLGYFGGPYWEVYPVDGDVGRVAIDDAAGLLELIEQSLSEQ